MKRLLAVLLALTLAFSLCGCAKTNVSIHDDVSLTFIHEKTHINVTLEADAAKSVIDILGQKRYDPIWTGVPTCGFDPNISLKVGDRVFAIACDSCNFVQDLNAQKYFSVSQNEMDQIRSLFEKYGGYFPCV